MTACGIVAVRKLPCHYLGSLCKTDGTALYSIEEVDSVLAAERGEM